MPDCGVYLMWPSEGSSWIHPEDIETANGWIPSTRVFRRHSFDGTYYRLQYGQQSIRVRPTLWLRVPDEGHSVGDRVEIKSCFQWNDPGLAEIVEIRWDKPLGRIVYTLQSRDLIHARPFLSEDFASLEKRPTLPAQIQDQVQVTNPPPA
jgi:hypothetical protein